MLFILLLGLAFSKTCTKKSVLSEDKCVAPQTIVDGCLVLENQEQNTCKQCTEGMQKTDKAACVAGTVENCIYYNGTECTLCDKGFGIKKDDKNVQTCVACPSGSNYCEFDGENEKNKLCYGSFDKDGKCISKVNITNCLEQISTNISGTVKNKCNKCDNYAKPNEDNTECWKIDHCENYKSKDECTKCADGYYVKDKKCAANTIANCYEQESDKVCTTCKDYYNLTETNEACESITINNCKKVKEDDVKLCAECKENYFVSSDATKCIENVPIANCKTHEIDNDVIKCTECNDKYNLTENACTSITINNCIRVDETDVKLCGLCDNGYHLSADSKECKSNIQNCQSQDKETEGETPKCTTCKEYYNLTETNEACESITINNCKKVKEDDVKLCGLCDNGHYLSSDEKTCPANNITNCQIQKSETECQTCDAGYEPSDDKKQCNKEVICADKCHSCDETGKYCYECEQELSDLIVLPNIDDEEFEKLVDVTSQDFYVLTNDKCVRHSLIVDVNDDNNEDNKSSSRGFVTMISLIFFIFVLF